VTFLLHTNAESQLLHVHPCASSNIIMTTATATKLGASSQVLSSRLPP